MLTNLAGLQLQALETKGVYNIEIVRGLDNQFLGRGQSFVPPAIHSTIKGIGKKQKELFVLKDNTEAQDWAKQKLSELSGELLTRLLETFYDNNKDIKNHLDGSIQNIKDLDTDTKIKLIGKKTSFAKALAYVSGFGLWEDYDISSGTVQFDYQNFSLFLKEPVDQFILVENSESGEHVALVKQAFYQLKENNESFVFVKKLSSLPNGNWNILISDNKPLPLLFAPAPLGKEKFCFASDSDWGNLDVLGDMLQIEDPSPAKVSQSILEQHINMPLTKNAFLRKNYVKKDNMEKIEDPLVGLYMYAHCIEESFFAPLVTPGALRISTWLSRFEKSKQNNLDFCFVEWPNVFED